VKDVLGHIAYWEGRAIGIVERTLTGEPDPPSGTDDEFEAINLREQAARAGWNVDETREELFGTHERFMAALRQCPGIDPDRIAGDTFEHYKEHAIDIRDWRARVGV
jgi:hypothetical protein